MNVALCQISNTLINPPNDNLTNEEVYFNNLYSLVPGYKKSADFWEIPLWIAKASYSMPDADLYIVRDIGQAAKDLRQYDVVMFSVLEVNKSLICSLIWKLPAHVRVILGGYIEEQYFNSSYWFPRVKWFNTLQAGIEFLGYQYKEGVSYKLFKRVETIPRLSMSDGCLYSCKFCCVEKTIREYSDDSIYWQIRAMKDLDFELIYLNDKTFGQAKNHELLPIFYSLAKYINPKFKGFIIQTTATNFLKLSDEVLKCVAYVELGIESCNDDILKSMNKPHRMEYIRDAAWRIRDLQLNNYPLKLIPNILVSLPGETKKSYQNTLDFLNSYARIISHVNIYSLAVYDNTKLASEIEYSEADKDENNLLKSWGNKELDTWFYNEVIKFADERINNESI